MIAQMANRSRRRSARRLRLAMFLGSGLLLTGGVLAAYATDVFGDSSSTRSTRASRFAAT